MAMHLPIRCVGAAIGLPQRQVPAIPVMLPAPELPPQARPGRPRIQARVGNATAFAAMDAADARRLAREDKQAAKEERRTERRQERHNRENALRTMAGRHHPATPLARLANAMQQRIPGRRPATVNPAALDLTRLPSNHAFPRLHFIRQGETPSQALDRITNERGHDHYIRPGSLRLVDDEFFIEDDQVDIEAENLPRALAGTADGQRNQF